MNIVVHSTRACPQCTNTKNLLFFSRLGFEEVVVERDSSEFAQLVSEGVRTFPVVDVYKDGERIDRWTGYSPEKVRALVEGQGELDTQEASSAVA